MPKFLRVMIVCALNALKEFAAQTDNPLDDAAVNSAVQIMRYVLKLDDNEVD